MSTEARRRAGARPVDARGSVSVLTASVLFLACVLVFVSADLVLVLAARSRAQTAADAAALAAAQELAIPTGNAPATFATDYASRNGATVVSCACAAGRSDAVVTVTISVHLLFLSPDRTVTATARAVVAGSG